MATSNSRSLTEPKILKSTALILLLIISALATIVPVINAQTVMEIPTNCYIAVAPNPSGVNQPLNIVFWLDQDPPQSSNTYYGWNYTVKIVNPEGKIINKGPYESDPVGGAYCIYTPDKIGEYKITVTFKEATLSVTPNGLMSLRGTFTFKSSTSREITLNVTEEAVVPWPEVPLPTGYWQNPVSAENRDWYQITGNWLAGGMGATFVNYWTTGPESAHMLWTKQITFGGITGGTAGWGINFYHGLLYENKFSPKIISGRLYYNIFAQSMPGVICCDLRTGETIWQNDSMPQISAAQILTFSSGVQTGTLAYLLSSNWILFDAFTGRQLANYSGASGSPSSCVNGPNGELLLFTLNGRSNTFSMWNSTLALKAGTTGFSAEQYTPWSTGSINWSKGIQYSVSIPDVPGTQSTGVTDYIDGVLVAESTITSSETSPTFVHVGYRLKDGQELWRHNWTDIGWGPGGASSPGLISYWAKAVGENTYTFFQKETMQWHVVELQTGEERFATEPLSEYTGSDWSVYDWAAQMAYGMLFVDGYSGDVIAFNLTTGEHMWTFEQGSSGLMTPYGVWPSFGGVTVADNKVYFGVTEHTPNTPMMRGYTLYCIDIKTGALMWKLPAFFASMAIADGVLVGYNAYDNQIYAFGKGLSEVIVDAPMSGVTVGSPIAIRGTVTDQSPGRTAVGVPAAGTPAISDDNMTAWMTYLYLQQPMPTTAKGVPVSLFISDENDNLVDTIQTESDVLGNFIASWTPTSTGIFKITADFGGSKSYYASTGATGVVVGAAAIAPTATPSPTPTSTPTEAPTPTASPSSMPGPEAPDYTAVYIGVSAVIIIVAIAAIAVFLRRRK